MFRHTHCGARNGLRAVWMIAALAATATTWGAMIVTSAPAHAKSPGARYCLARACHRVMTLAQTRAAVGKPVTAVTSFYDDCRRDRYNPCGLTSSGEAFRPGESNSAASPIYPDGTIILVRNPRNGESAIVRINNAGPYWGNRTLDLSRAAGIGLGLGRAGVAEVEVTVLRAPSRREATYRKGRRYPSLPGHVGRFASLDEARVFAAVELELPDAFGDSTITVAHADPQAVTVTPVGYTSITRPRPEHRLPADIVRVSAIEPRGDGTVVDHDAVALAESSAVNVHADPLMARAVKIRGASLLLPPAGETTRVVSERAAIMGALRAGDIDRRAKSLLPPLATQPGDAAIPRPSPASLAHVRAGDRALRGAERLTLERMPPFATLGERSWYRRSLAAASDAVDFAPTGIAARGTQTARWAALRVASFTPPQQSAEPLAQIANVSSGDDHLHDITRPLARARNEFDVNPA
jgi:hypothetical protein